MRPCITITFHWPLRHYIVWNKPTHSLYQVKPRVEYAAKPIIKTIVIVPIGINI